MHLRAQGPFRNQKRSVLYRVVRGAALTVLLMVAGLQGLNAAEDMPPNIVFILCDNLGYGDTGCYGSSQHRTPHIDQLAAEGLRLTSFYSASGVCTPSRAALMTGCYPRRVGLDWTDPDGHVLRPVSPNGLHPDEVTIAEVLKSAGYATTCIGKWHLGDQLSFLPTRQGFDSWFGIPYSDDMTPRPGRNWPALPLMRNDRVVEAPVDRDLLTRKYTDAACRFIEQNSDGPFFLYIPHAMPGSTREPFASEDFRGKSANGAYGDSVEELDWSTGQILDTLKRRGIDDRTLVVWTSDNGAPRRNPVQGSNAPLGGWGYSVAEGGMRVPCIIRWPDVVPAGTVSDAVTSMMDWLPTFASICERQLDPNRRRDGFDIAALLKDPRHTESPYDVFLYYHRNELQAARSGKWKVYLTISASSEAVPQRMYDLDADPGESSDVLQSQPDIAASIAAAATAKAADLGSGEQRGPGIRTVGRVDQPGPRVLDSEPADQ